ncbi:hypothetical protein POTOM_014168 [Populus tomentosa]|uniref:Uncharacterized protein n=1 Tax=Populus tomentosa TaxID=118781 RepID=A0A8X8A7D2_POPTO|nr:hypothetical protein POTOM_014168 [Populus tomentosa]
MPKLRKAALSCLVICTVKGSLMLHLRDSSVHPEAHRRPLSSHAPPISSPQPADLVVNMKREAKDHIKEEHLMSNLKLSDSEGNSTNEFNDQIPDLPQADGDGNTFPPGTSIDAVPSDNLNVASKKMRKRKFGTSDGGKQQKVKLDEFGCKRMKNENTSMEAENELMMDKCAREINDLSRKRQTVEYLKEKCNEETAVIAELSMILINNGNENVIELRERIEQLESSRAQLLAGIAQLREL